MQAFAQHRFHGGLPARVDAQLLPQARQRAQAVPLLPFAQGRVVFGRALDLAQGRKLRLGCRVLALRRAERLAGRGAALFERCALGLQRFVPGLRCLRGCLERGDSRLQGVRRRRIRLGERLQLALEALAALLERLSAALQVREIGLLELQAAFRLQQLAASLAQPLLAGAERLLGLRQARVLLPELCLRFGAALLRRAGAGHPHVKRLRKLRALLAPGAQLREPLRMLALQPLAGLLDMAQLGLEPGYLGIRGVERRLRRVQGVPGAVMRHARRFHARLEMPQLGVLCFELVRDLRHFLRVALALRRGVAAARIPKQLLPELQLRVVFLVARRHRGLRLELLQLRAKLGADVGDAREIAARVSEAILGLAAALLVLRDAGRLLEEHAQLLGLRLDDARDHPLLDDRVGPRAKAGAEEHVGDVAAPDVHAVDVVARLAVALQDALDGDLRVLRPLSGHAPLSVVEDQLDRGARERRAVHRAVEDDVLHRVAAQRRGARLAEHPAHGVDDVGLAAAVRPDDADQLPRHVYRGGIDEGLEAGELYLNESHGKNDTIARRSPRDALAPQQAAANVFQSCARARLSHPHGSSRVHVRLPADRAA